MNQDPSAREAALAEFNRRAASAAREVGRERLALELEGRAIDSLIRADAVEEALALCREVVMESPGVVRTWCTLAWLDIGRGHFASACRSVDRYVAAAEQSGQAPLAVNQLRRMAEFGADEEFRLHVADKLMLLADEKWANDIIGINLAQRNGLRPPMTDDPVQRLVDACRAALQPMEPIKVPEGEAEAPEA